MEGDGVMDNERTGGASVVRVTPKRFIEVWSLSFFGPVVVSWFVDVARTLAGIWVHWAALFDMLHCSVTTWRLQPEDYRVPGRSVKIKNHGSTGQPMRHDAAKNAIELP
ncbi:FACT complex subunit [Venturia inaequalis]|nr:FACT complex subunit [Venturia inaequalis]